MVVDRDSLFSETLIRQVELQAMRVGLQQSLDPVILQDLDLREIQSHLLGQFILQVRGHFWAQDPKRISVSYPSDWREAFKQRWLPKWALERWPVKLTTKTLEGQLFYPLLPQTDHQNQYRIRFAIWEGDKNKSYA